MPKTYTTLSSVATGDVLTATNFNNLQTTVNNHTVPPMCRVYLTANRTVTSAANISWDAVDSSMNTDSMWTSGATMTVNTAGIYLVTFSGRFTLSAGVSTFDAAIVRDSTTIMQWDPAPESGYPSSDFRINGSVVASFTAGQTISSKVIVSGTITGDGVNAGLIVSLAAVWMGKNA